VYKYAVQMIDGDVPIIDGLELRTAALVDLAVATAKCCQRLSDSSSHGSVVFAVLATITAAMIFAQTLARIGTV
jgi:hypothetical protein